MNWMDYALCQDMSPKSRDDPNLFYEDYEMGRSHSEIDSMCLRCPVTKNCFETGVSNKEWGVWGGIYLEEGFVSTEFNAHKSNEDWQKILELRNA